MIRVGTSGWSYPHWREVFYPKSLGSNRWLSYYAQRFPSVEINATFYRLPSEATVRNWASQAPEGFLFAVKLSRIITHRKKLREVQEPLNLFVQRVRILANHMGPVLVQLPPRWRRNAPRLEAFLSSLPRDLMVAVEFRDPSWFHPEIYDLLHRVGAAFCRHDMRDLPVPAVSTGPFRYIRLHGPAGPYAGSYSPAELERWAGEILSDPGDEGTFIYFNNDVGGYAPINALQLMEILDRLG